MKSCFRALLAEPRDDGKVTQYITRGCLMTFSRHLCESLTVDFKDGQTGPCPGKASSGGLIVVVVAIILPPTSFIASQYFCKTKEPAETSTKKNAGKGG